MTTASTGVDHAAGPSGAAIAAINLRCLEGVEVSTLKRVAVDGRSR